MEKKSLSLVVAGRTYPLTVSEGEQERVLSAAEDINKAIQILKENYAVKDMQDLLAMAALQMATKARSGHTVSTPSASADYSAIEKSLDALSAELDELK
jgi:L-lactate utilization protein LutC|tara:strand:- start:16930 stop:17226 length:297 start_codon:yes stop_codon:yes gene_type:complete